MTREAKTEGKLIPQLPCMKPRLKQRILPGCVCTERGFGTAAQTERFEWRSVETALNRVQLGLRVVQVLQTINGRKLYKDEQR